MSILNALLFSLLASRTTATYQFADWEDSRRASSPLGAALFPSDNLGTHYSDELGTVAEACLTARDAHTIAEDFALLTGGYARNPAYSEQLLNTTYTEDLHAWSDSVRVLLSAGCTNGPEPMDKNRAEFAYDELHGPPFEFVVLRVWNSCDVVTFLWERPSPTGQRVRGIIVLETVLASKDSPVKRLVKTAYSEFNTASWFVNQGILKPSNCENAAAPLHW